LPTLTKENLTQLLLQNILTTTRILKKIKPDIVHLHAQHYLSPAIILNNLPYVLTSWGIEVLNLPQANFFFKSWAKITAKKAKMITLDAKLLKDIWVKNGIPANKIKVIPFGVDTSLFNPKIDGTSVRKKLQIENNDTVVISTRPFYNHHYDVERLIRAIPLVLKNHSNAKFIIKGRGPLEDCLKSLAKKLKVSEHIRFVGITPYNEIGQYLSAADIYVSTCFRDTTSVSLLEAMACELAPVVTDTIGNREWIEDEVNGFLFPPRNHAKLAEKISQLIENKPLRKNFGEKCAEIVKEKADWKKNVAEMETIYKSSL
jgi:glycosyltransferase involved in cell wall biosynthesis